MTVVVALDLGWGNKKILNMKVNRELSDRLVERRDTLKECPYILY